ncbi:MAG: thioredoxin [Phycisphaerae bacterium]|nr:thioredoxin [Phycisphaerae bacterium]
MPPRNGDLTVASDAVLNFTDEGFQADVLDSDVPVLVDFWAEWCQPCKMLTPTIDAIAEEYAGRAKVGKMNIDDHKQVALARNIQSIPTVLIFKNGEVAQTFVGIAAKDKITEALDAAM